MIPIMIDQAATANYDTNTKTITYYEVLIYTTTAVVHCILPDTIGHTLVYIKRYNAVYMLF